MNKITNIKSIYILCVFFYDVLLQYVFKHKFIIFCFTFCNNNKFWFCTSRHENITFLDIFRLLLHNLYYFCHVHVFITYLRFTKTSHPVTLFMSFSWHTHQHATHTLYSIILILKYVCALKYEEYTNYIIYALMAIFFQIFQTWSYIVLYITDIIHICA